MLPSPGPVCRQYPDPCPPSEFDAEFDRADARESIAKGSGLLGKARRNQATRQHYVAGPQCPAGLGQMIRQPSQRHERVSENVAPIAAIDLLPIQRYDSCG